MSAIAGYLGLDGRPARADELERMTESLAHRGPDGLGIWHEGSVGLGHRMLHTTPESLSERLPFHLDGLAITADTRIDNREELIHALQLESRPQEHLSDSELVLHAYRKWGEACPTRLLGDFAFAIWDRTRQSLFCARDPLGVRPFYFYKSDRLFAFASAISALIELPGVPRRLDELRVGYHLVPTVEDKTVTFYRDIRRLLPGHSLTVSAGTVRFRAYWSLDGDRALHLPSDDDYTQAFREIFLEAVRCRLRSAFPIGSTLSGGLDSSSVTGAAAHWLAQTGGPPLPTFSAVFDRTPQCDERPYMDAVLSRGGMQAHFVAADSLNPFAGLEQAFQSMDEPISSPTLYIYSGLCRVAREQGVRVLLDGFDGDTAVHHGDSYLAELARAGEWASFAAEARAIAGHENLPSVPMLIRQYGLPYLTELARTNRWHTFARESGGFARQFGLDRRKVYWHCAVEPRLLAPLRRLRQHLRDQDDNVPGIGNLIRRDFARRISLPERMQALTAKQAVPPQTAREEHYNMLNSGLIAYAFETIDQASMAFGIEGRHPFSDRRLIEFCLALPANQKLHRGWTRMIVRRALPDMLPEKVLWRGGKTVNSPAVTAAFGEVKTGLLKDVIEGDPGALGQYVERSAVARDLPAVSGTTGSPRRTAHLAGSHSGIMASAHGVGQLMPWLHVAREP